METQIKSRLNHIGCLAATRAMMVSVFVIVGAALAAPAHADDGTVQKIDLLARKAMENFDNFDYEAAKKLLNGAVDKARSAGLETDPILARVYMNLAIVHFSGENDVDSARAAFVEAVKIDPDIDIDPAYKTKDMEALLDEVKQAYGGPRSADCSAVSGLSHTLIDVTEAGVDRPVEVLAGSDLAAARVVLYYRVHSDQGSPVDFTEVPMTSDNGCKYTAVIPGSALSPGVVHYYVSAYDDKGEEVASKGTERTPNLIEVTVGGSGADRDNPLLAEEGEGAAGPARFFVTVAGGTGGGYITGETELVKAPINCCFALAPVHVFPEFGYFLAPGMSISLAFRMGFAVGANIENHATGAPSAMLRFRRGLLEQKDEGLFFTAALGGGVVRQIVTVVDQPEGMNVDTSAIGPMLLGGGLGYTKRLGGPARFNAELNLTMGVPVVGELGTAQLNFGMQFDLNIGLMFAF